MTEGKKYYFDADNWEFTTSDKSIIVDALDSGDADIIQMGVLVRAADVFITQRYNEEKDEYETSEFNTKEEAEAWKQELSAG